MAEMSLPDGWTIERVREHAQANGLELISLDREVFIRASGDDEQVAPSVILHVGGLYLVLAEGDTDDWMMGDADDNGTIRCWAYYGALGDALRAV